MTEKEWLMSVDSAKMLDFVLGQRDHRDRKRFGFPISDRKLRLWCYAWRIAAGYDPNGVAYVEDADPPTVIELFSTRGWAMSLASLEAVKPEVQAYLLRHIVGNPWRPGVTRECIRCNGKGSDPNTSIATCVCCQGRGWLLVELPVEACTVKCNGCNGTGEWWADAVSVNAPLKCGKCGGKKRVRKRITHFPALVTSLAAAVYDGDKSAVLALHDELHDCCPELAQHFDSWASCNECSETGQVAVEGGHGDTDHIWCPKCYSGIEWDRMLGRPGAHPGKVRSNHHPKGCWALDLILGKE